MNTMCNELLVCVLTFCMLVSNTSAKNGKAMYFLRAPSFEGDLPDQDNGYQDPISVDNAGAHKVLFGHYSSILENRHRQPVSHTRTSLAGRSLNSRPRTQLRNKLQVSKVVEIYRKNLFLTIKSAVDQTSGSKSGDFQTQLESCKETLKQCDALGDLEIRCGVKCLGKGNNILSGLSNTIASLADRFCFPINTIFDKFFEVKGKLKHPNLRRFKLFLKRFTASKKTWLDVAAQGAAALVPIIIEKVRTDMMPFRLLNDKLETELEAEEILQPGVDTESMISNTLCQNVDNADIAADLLDVLYRNPTLVEAVLGGLTSMNLISKYIPGRFQVPFAASAEAIRILTGSICGLIEFAETGRVPSCDQIGGFPVPGIPLPEIPEMPKLNPECLQGSEFNGEDKDGTEDDANPFRLPDSNTAPSAGPAKREVGSRKDTAVAEIDGVEGKGSNLGLNGRGNGAELWRKKRSLIVGKK